jgi:hypothetical protein
VVSGSENGYLGIADHAYRLPVLGPLAAGGAARVGRSRSWRALILLLVWTAAGAAALLALVAGLRVHASRIWPF